MKVVWVIVATIGVLLITSSFILWGFAIWNNGTDLSEKLGMTGLLPILPGILLLVFGVDKYNWVDNG